MDIPRQYAEKVRLEGANHAFGDVAVVHIGWYLLVFTFPLVGDTIDIGGACFIVEYM